MELTTESEGADSMGRKNACQREKECGREGGNTRSSNRMTLVIHIDHSGHPYRWLGSAIWMTRVKRYEKSIFSPSSIGIFSLSSSFTTPIAIERCMRLVSSRRTPFTLNSLFLRNKKTFVKGFFHTINYYRPTQTDAEDYKNANGLKFIQLFT